MSNQSRIFDRIRIKPRTAERASATQETCQREGCSAPGLYRAPMGRGNEGKYWRFCLEHVREYNASYNYFAGMTDDAVAAYQKDAVIGHRPTWRVSVNTSGRQAPRGAGTEAPAEAPSYADPLGLFDWVRPGQPAAEPPRRAFPARVRAAFDTLGLEETADGPTIKSRYKTLVKRFHPDANGGDRSYEGRLQDIIRAHDTLKQAGLC